MPIITTPLTTNDYKYILQYYNISIPESNTHLQSIAEKIISEKLCKCIKKLEPKYEEKSVGICTRTIINRKGFFRGKFQCKNKRFITLRKHVKSKKSKNPK